MGTKAYKVGHGRWAHLRGKRLELVPAGRVQIERVIYRAAETHTALIRSDDTTEPPKSIPNYPRLPQTPLREHIMWHSPT